MQEKTPIALEVRSHKDDAEPQWQKQVRVAPETPVETARFPTEPRARAQACQVANEEASRAALAPVLRVAKLAEAEMTKRRDTSGQSCLR